MYLSVSASPESSSVSSRLRAPRSSKAMSEGPHLCAVPLLRRRSGGDQKTRRDHQPEQRERQKNLPAETHQLVVAEARKRRANPEEQEKAERDLEDEPDRPR